MKLLLAGDSEVRVGIECHSTGAIPSSLSTHLSEWAGSLRVVAYDATSGLREGEGS